MAKQAQTLTRDAIQYETKRDFSKSDKSSLWHISMSAGNYFYSYIIIPATINHNNVYTITDD